MARRNRTGARLLPRNGHDWGPRYPVVVEAVAALRVRSCLIDGEAVCCDDKGVAVISGRSHLTKVQESNGARGETGKPRRIGLTEN